MPTERLAMQKIRDVLRLKFANGLSEREIAESLRIGHSTAGEFIRRARAAGLSWPLPEGMNDTELEVRVYPKSEGTKAARAEPAWASVHVELRRPDVTLMLLWTEYRAEHPDGYSYSRVAGDLLDVWPQRLHAPRGKALGDQRAQPAMFRWIVAIHAARGVLEHGPRTEERPSALGAKRVPPHSRVSQHRRDLLIACNQPSHLAPMH
jgi:hypothetical protein